MIEFVRALIATYEKKDAVIIPASSLKKKEADYFVYVVQKEEPKAEVKEEKPKEKAKKKLLNLMPNWKKQTSICGEISPFIEHGRSSEGERRAVQ